MVSFEPVPSSYEKLKQTISLNSMTSLIHAYPLAVGDGQQTLITIYVPRHHSFACSSSRVDDPATAIPYSCEIIALDQADFFRDEPALIKVDVEGAELSVLKGAKHICQSTKSPIWVLEINHGAANRFGYQPEDLAIWLLQWNYTHFFR